MYIYIYVYIVKIACLLYCIQKCSNNDNNNHNDNNNNRSGFFEFNFAIFWFCLYIPEKSANQYMYNLFLY